MRRFVFLFVLLPVAVVAIVLSVANRHAVTVSLDPFSAAPAWSVTLPLFVVLFAALGLGVLLGGAAAWVKQGYWRKLARAEHAELDRARREADQLRARLAAPALPPQRDAA